MSRSPSTSIIHSLHRLRATMSDNSSDAGSVTSIKSIKGRPHRKHVHRGLGAVKAKKLKTQAEPQAPIQAGAAANPSPRFEKLTEGEYQVVLQRLLLRGAAGSGGMETADALLSAMRARQEICGWNFPEGVPHDSKSFQRQLVDSGKRIADLEPLDTPMLLLNSTLTLSSWSAEPLPPCTSLPRGQTPATLAEYLEVFGRRQPVLSTFMLALAAYHVRCRIMVLEPEVDDPTSPRWDPEQVRWRVAHDFRPCDDPDIGPIPSDRIIVLATHYGARGLIGHSWAHPSCDLCGDLHRRGHEESWTTIKFNLNSARKLKRKEGIPDWHNDRGTGVVQPFEVVADEDVIYLQPAQRGPAADGIAQLLEEHPEATTDVWVAKKGASLAPVVGNCKPPETNLGPPSPIPPPTPRIERNKTRACAE